MSAPYFGSQWYKFDFHTHTPASSDYKSPEDTEGDWLKSLMASEVDCVAVTDHVTGEWIDRIKDSYAKLENSGDNNFRPLHIFPGCEITVSTGQSRIHILAIFDPNTDSAKITGVLGRCGITNGHGDAENTTSTESVDKVIELIFEEGGVAIPAHIDGPKGLLHNIVNTNLELETWLGKIEAAEFLNIQYLNQVDPELGKAAEHLAIVRGSDAHKCEDLGNRTTWIKMSFPSIEGLKLALHDHSFCVENSDENPNALPNVFLSNLTIEKMRHCGQIDGKPTTFQLHPLFNAIIGGRGSGKSTFIESLRLSLGREKEVYDLPAIKTDVLSFKEGVTSEHTKISALINRRDEKFQTVWSKVESSQIFKDIDGTWTKDNGRPEDRFNFSIYSQKQINALASNSNSLLEIIDRATEVNYSAWKYSYDEELNKFLELSREVRTLHNKLNNKSTYQAQLDDVISDIDSFEKGGHKDVFNAFQKLSIEKQVLNSSIEIDDIIESFDYIIKAKLDEISVKENDSDSLKEVAGIHKQFLSEYEAIQGKVSTLKDRLNQKKETRNKAIEESSWTSNSEDIEKRYDEVVAEYKDKGEELNPEQYEAWIKERTRLNQIISELDELQVEINQKLELCKRSLKKLYKLRRLLQKDRLRFIDKVIGDNPYVRMKLLPFADTTNLESQFRSHIATESGYLSSIYQEDSPKSLLYNLINSDKDPLSIVRCCDQIKNLLFKLANGELSDEYKLHAKFVSSLEDKMVNHPENFDRLSAWWPDDKLVVEYAKDPIKPKFENIERGSAGQKAAAILAFLLSHGDDPIIVDQPEDDLDNALIYQLIVSQIHLNKKRRQIIMVTHNPNIVVNGDAEFVNVLEFRGGQVQILECGGLCELKIRDHVCTIMEGGIDAFDKRYKRLRQI